MRWWNARAKGLLFALSALVACDSCDGENGTNCTVAQLDGGVGIACGDGSDASIPSPPPAEPCSVERADGEITFRCPDGSEITLPIGGGADAGIQSCSVSEMGDGSIAISCPDGSSAVISAPAGDAGADGGTAALVRYGGAVATACGACHDTDANKTHFVAMTAWVDGKPIEDCGSCHKEGGIQPVSTAHARLELGPPGFQVEILGASIDPTTRRATVQLRVQDGAGNPLTRTGVSTNFVIGRVPTESTVGTAASVAGPYTSYITRTVTQQDNPDFPLDGAPRVVSQPTGESNGAYTNPEAGRYDYTFANALPADYNPNLTHVISLYATRTVGPVRWVSNDSYFFVPAGGATPLRRTVVQTETCNGCHNPLGAHGGSRQDVDLCLGCHSEGAVDPESDNSIDLNVMIHRIHMGADLPSVRGGRPYMIVGRNNATADFSHVRYPRDIVHCQSCHTETDDDRWVSNGKAEACMSCHDDIYEPDAHPFALAPNAVCGNGACHGPNGSAPDARESHRTFLNTDAPIFDISIVSATVENADAAPALRVRALTGTRSSGAMTPVASADHLSTLNVFFNGPNSDYAFNGHDIKQYNKAALVDLAATSTAGEFTFSLPETLREAAGTAGDATADSFTLSIRAVYDPTPGAGPDNDRVDMMENPTIAISAAGAPVARVAAVETAKCNACHGDLRAHGGDILARNVEECIMCHTASLDTAPRQGANKEPGPTRSLRFSMLVHRIHAGHSASDPYVLYGFAPMAPYPQVDFSGMAFPGDLRDCTACHVDTANYLPLTASRAPTETRVLDGEGRPIAQ